jgi:hypothetical protein
MQQTTSGIFSEKLRVKTGVLPLQSAIKIKLLENSFSFSSHCK